MHDDDDTRDDTESDDLRRRVQKAEIEARASRFAITFDAAGNMTVMPREPDA